MSTANRPFSSPIRTSTVLRLAWPVVVSMLSYTATSLVDVLVVGSLGTIPLAAVGLAVTGMYLVRAMGFGLLSGVRIATAQAVGAGRTEAVARLGWHTVYLALVLGVLAVPPILGSHALFRLSGASEEVAVMASAYMDVRLLGAVFAYLLFGLTAWFQGSGDTRTPMVANVLANAVNMGLTPAFVFGLGPFPATGIRGVAVATVLGTVVGAVWLLAPLIRSTPLVSRALDRGLASEIWRFGWPLGLSWTLDVGSFAGFAVVLSICGDAHLAAHVLVVRIISVSFLPGHAIAEATGVLTGQAVGAMRPDAAWQAISAGLRIALVTMLAFGVVFWLFPTAVLAPFGVEADVAAIGIRLLFIAAGFQVFDAVAMVLYQGLAGAGDTRFMTVVTTTAAWCVKLPLGYALAIPFGMGAAGAWLGMTVEIIALAAVFALRLRSGRWLQVKRAAAPVVAP